MPTPIAFPVEEDSQEDMKLRAEEKDWLKGEVGRQVGTAVEAAIDSFRPYGLRKLAYWLRQWSAVAVPFTVIVGILAGSTETTPFPSYFSPSREALLPPIRECRFRWHFELLLAHLGHES